MIEIQCKSVETAIYSWYFKSYFNELKTIILSDKERHPF